MKKVDIPGLTKEEKERADKFAEDLTVTFTKSMIKYDISDKEALYGLATFGAAMLNGMEDEVDGKKAEDVFCDALKTIKVAMDDNYEKSMDEGMIQKLHALSSLVFQGLFPKKKKKDAS